MKKKLLSAVLSATMVASMLAGCGSSEPTQTTTDDKAATTEVKEEVKTDAPAADTSADTADAAATGKVYYLNFKPEQAQAWEALAAKYTEETGVEVSVQTAASGTYESTLKSEIAKTDAPTMFQVNGPVGLATWSDYCYDLAGTDVYAELKSDDFALKEGDAVKGLAYVVETYGIIYNADILNTYFGKDYAVVKSVEEINSFEQLKAVADSIQENADDLGVKGAFTSAGMDSSSDWRFKTHLANLPIYYEYQADGIGATDAIKGTYIDNYKAIWDLYITDSTCAPTVLSSKTGEDATAEFALGEAVFYQNGTWAYGDLSANGMADESLGMLPIYIGAEGEENQGLCTGSENYWCVNKNAPEEDIQATLDFMKWVVTSDAGCTALSGEMGFVCPFKAFDNYPATNPLINIANDYVSSGKKAVAWTFTTMPSEEWKNGVGSALLEYAQGTGDWDKVKEAFVEGWATEYSAVNN
ncbi:MAG: ABC transporter substrate-binding protein [Lachnospiraceae bacterium]|nr:ABC transporter substrate-binding protein [Lachnospiraceae bacterium]